MDTSIPTTAELAELIAAVEKCRESKTPEAMRVCLAAAAALVEHAAYELARTPQPQHVPSLILVSAELDRIAGALPGAKPEAA